MTKYILQSGGIGRNPIQKQLFHRELVKDLNNTPHILLCMFAQAREDWESKYPSYCDTIVEDMPTGVHPTFEIALPATFEAQCKNADIISISGGDDHLVQFWLKKYDLQSLFKNKVVAGNSSGSAALVSSFWACDWRQCLNGLDVLPIKFVYHYQSDWGEDDPRGPVDWQAAYDELAAYGNTSLPIHALKEGEFIVLEQE